MSLQRSQLLETDIEIANNTVVVHPEISNASAISDLQ